MASNVVKYPGFLEYLPPIQSIANIVISLAPLFSYGTTCYSIYRRQTLMGFSIDICATMLMAAILRIFYYMIVPYEISLLRQSITMIIIQLILLKVSLKYRQKNYSPEFLEPMPSFQHSFQSRLPRRLSILGQIILHHDYSKPSEPFSPTSPSSSSSSSSPSSTGYSINSITKDYSLWSSWLNFLSDLKLYCSTYLSLGLFYVLNFFDVYYRRPGLFWQWEDEWKYWQYIMKFTTVFAILTAIFYGSETYGTCIGLLGLFIESLLPLPQILLLNRVKSIKNFKLILLVSWLCGDLTKLSYLVFGARDTLIIFFLAGFFQMCLDLIILYQYIYFKNNEAEEPELDIALNHI